jgi:ParB family chromosome partitioning protein
MTEIELTAGNVKAAMRDADAKSADLWMVPVDQLRLLPGFNIRPIKAEHVAALKEAIRANGYNRGEVLKGFVSKDGDSGNIINVWDGQHRLTAVRELIAEGVPIEFLPVVVSPAGTSMVDVTVGMIETSDKKMALAPQDWATACKRLIGFGVGVDEIAQRLGKTKQQVGDYLVLAGASRRVLSMVEEKKVSGTNAIKLLKKHGAGTAEVLDKTFEAALARGKKKVTAATLSPQRDLVADATAWINGNCATGDLTPLVAMLSHLTGTPHADIAARIEAQGAN